MLHSAGSQILVKIGSQEPWAVADMASGQTETINRSD
jgi:hypothetical protein